MTIMNIDHKNIANRLQSEIIYATKLLESCFENALSPSERIFRRFQAIADVFLSDTSSFDEFKRGILDACKLLSNDRTVSIPSSFTQNLNNCKDRFSLRMIDEPDLQSKIKSIEIATALLRTDSPKNNLVDSINDSESFEDVMVQIKSISLSQEELEASLNVTAKLINKLDRECPDELLIELSDILLDLEDKTTGNLLPKEMYLTFYQICDNCTNPVPATRALMYHACSDVDSIGNPSAEHIVLAVRRLDINGKFNNAARFVSGVLYGAIDLSDPEQVKQTMKDCLPILLYRLNKVDNQMFDSESVKSCLKDFGCEDDDGGSNVDSDNPSVLT
jgi:hypothetical protein